MHGPSLPPFLKREINHMLPLLKGKVNEWKMHDFKLKRTE
jgi:hypothetical protein